MSSATSDLSMNHLGFRGRNGVLEVLPFRAWTYRPDWFEIDAFEYNLKEDGPIFKVEWHTLNLQSGEISETLSTMPLEARDFGAAVACGNRVYVIGGLCRGNPFCPEEIYDFAHAENSVFYLDCELPGCEWKQAPPMLAPRMLPSVVATPEKIYVFGSTGCAIAAPFAEVLDVDLNCWDKLSGPPYASGMDPEFASDPVVFQSSRSRILVHLDSSRSLHAFNLMSESWECLNQEFGEWPPLSAVVDDVLYCLFDPPPGRGPSSFSDIREYLCAYHLADKEWLRINWLSKFELPASSGDVNLIHLGNGLMFLGWYCVNGYLCHIKFSVRLEDGVILATGMSSNNEESDAFFRSSPFQTNLSDFMVL